MKTPLFLNNTRTESPETETRFQKKEGNIPRLAAVMTRREMEAFFTEESLRQMVTYFPESVFLSDEDLRHGRIVEILDRIRPDIILTAWGTPPFSGEDWEHLRHYLKYVCHLTGKVRNIIPRSFIEAGLLVTNWGNAVAKSVAECALMHVLCCLRGATNYNMMMHIEKSWRGGPFDLDGESLFNKRVGIHGFGYVARELVALMRPFSVSVKSYSEGVPPSLFMEHGVEMAENLEDLFSDVDVLVELESASPANYKIVNERILRRLKPGAVFVNVGRAAVVDEDALARMAMEGVIRVGLDVYTEEPLAADSSFRGLRNVFLTPHVGGPTRDMRFACGDTALRNVIHYLNNEPLEHQVSLDVYDRIT